MDAKYLRAGFDREISYKTKFLAKPALTVLYVTQAVRIFNFSKKSDIDAS
jgi:hypothetical protein